MIKKMTSSMPGYVCVSFELPSCLWADRIYLVGDFNQWNESANPMRQERDGVWRAVLELPQGARYEFRYLIDGKWMSDSHADGFAPNHYGVSNSIVHTALPVPTITGTDGQIRETARQHGHNVHQFTTVDRNPYHLSPGYSSDKPILARQRLQRIAA